MSCCGGRDKDGPIKATQKWDYINLNDFQSTSCLTPFSYAFLWIMLGVSIASYVADFSTMINLLFWDRYSSNSIQPPKIFGTAAIPRWVFTGCILLSYVLLIVRWMKALRAMRSGGVAKNYLDPLAVRVQSIRPGRFGRGYRRFRVFAELTKSKHGTEYIALFVYFAFESWLRVIFAEAPRSVINGYTIYHLIDTWADASNSPDKNKNDSGIQKFWAAYLAQANSNKIQAAVFIGMIFTTFIWVLAFISLAIAFILYVMFVWHHIPQQDGGLRGYCKRKVDKSVEKIVSAKIKQALADEQKKAEKAAKKAAKEAKKAGFKEAPIADVKKKQPTLPVLMDEEAGELPPYRTRPNTPGSVFDKQPTLPDLDPPFARPGMSRTGTGTSQGSFSSNAPLLREAAEFGESEPSRSFSPAPTHMSGRPFSPAPTSSSSQHGGRPFSPAPTTLGGRPLSPAGARSASPAPPPRPFTPDLDLIPGRAADRSASPAPQRPFTPSAGPQRPFSPAAPSLALGASSRTPGPSPLQSLATSDLRSETASPAPTLPRQLTPANGSMSQRPPVGLSIPRAGSTLSAPMNGRGTPMQPPPRSNTAVPFGSQGRQTPASFSRPGAYGQRALNGMTEAPQEEYEMQPQTRPPPPSISTPSSYQAYRPAAAPSPLQSPQTPATPSRPLLSPPEQHVDPRSSAYGASILDDYVYDETESHHSLDYEEAYGHEHHARHW